MSEVHCDRCGESHWLPEAAAPTLALRDVALDTIERIRNAVGPPRYPMETESWHYIIAILDKEAAALAAQPTSAEDSE